MLTTFDWLRRSENGTELIATIDAMRSTSQLFHEETMMGPPVHGINGPCTRCWIFPRLPALSHCKICDTILTESKNLGPLSRQCLLIWGFVNFLPDNVKRHSDLNETQTRCVFIHDDTHFLAVVNSYGLTGWLREIILHHGSELKGLLTIFPTTGKKQTFTMGDILCRAIHHDSRFPMDRLRIRFFPKPGQLKVPHKREKQGILTFETSEFISLLEMATTFKSRLRPEEQEMVKEVISITDHHEKAFHWGRLMSALNIEARDMLSDWKFRQWPKNRIKFLYELIDHVHFTA